MSVTLYLNRLDGAGVEQIELDDDEYITDSDGNVIAFVDYDHSDNENHHYTLYKLRLSGHDHKNWFSEIYHSARDATAPARWASSGMKTGDKIGGKLGGPRHAARYGRYGFVTGALLGVAMPYARDSFFRHYRENGGSGELCYSDSAGHEIYSGPVRA